MRNSRPRRARANSVFARPICEVAGQFRACTLAEAAFLPVRGVGMRVVLKKGWGDANEWWFETGFWVDMCGGTVFER